MELAALCSEALQRLALFEFTYPLTNGLLKDHLQQAFPVATKEQIEGWIASGKIQHYFWDGQEHYTENAAANLKYDMEIMHADDVSNQVYGEVVRGINEIAIEEPEHFWKQYQKPVTYRGIHTVSIPRSELRQEGTYRVWFPVPIITGPQTQVTIESIVPDKWVKQPPSIDEDIGLVYGDPDGGPDGGPVHPDQVRLYPPRAEVYCGPGQRWRATRSLPSTRNTRGPMAALRSLRRSGRWQPDSRR